jgi:cytochrome c oxidase subunit III
MSHAVAHVAPGDPPHVHHMDSNTAYHAAKFGMWLFLATEITLFAAMFVAFSLYRFVYFNEFHHASTELNWKMGALNTIILIASSLTAALAVDSAQKGSNSGVIKNLGFSILCGVGFLVIKTIEYSSKASHGLFPFTEGYQAQFAQNKMFFGLYYCMTGLHALHVIIGMAVLGWVVSLAMKGRFSERYYTPVELGALYWHLVDLIWIYLFPLLYLVG